MGLFGSRTVGQLLVRQIIFELNRQGKFLRDMAPVEAEYVHQFFKYDAR